MANTRLLAELRHAAAERQKRAMHRELRLTSAVGPMVRRANRDLVNLASNDYLGLSNHPRMRDAVAEAAREFGVGAGASRLVCGHLPIHEQVERALARFKHAEAAFLLPTGYMANLAAITALARPGDLICQDKLNHASLFDAARLSGATLRIYPHRQTAKLARLLAQHRKRTKQDGQTARRFIVTDAVFSMDGDVADLPSLCDLAAEHDAIVIVDEAHASGLLGASGAGLCEHQGVSERVDVVVSTASKALGSLGGVVSAAVPIIETLVNHARAAIYSTAVPPTQAAAIMAALEVVQGEPGRRERVLGLARELRAGLRGQGWAAGEQETATPIVPLIVGTAERALDLAAYLEASGILAVAIRPPTVPPGTARVRLSLRADLPDRTIERLLDVLEEWPSVWAGHEKKHAAAEPQRAGEAD